MKNTININTINLVEEIPNYWNNVDYINLLEKFDFPDSKSIKPENLLGMLHMAIGDFEPNQAAAILLNYKLSDRLNEGQIEQISNDMLMDKVCEEYPEIDLHNELFCINQFLYKAYNGRFPNAKAIVVEFTINGEVEKEITKEVVLKLFNSGLSESNIIKRLYDNEMSSEAAFPDAESILWDLTKNENHRYSFTTSEYWINKEDIIFSEFTGECN